MNICPTWRCNVWKAMVVSSEYSCMRAIVQPMTPWWEKDIRHIIYHKTDPWSLILLFYFCSFPLFSEGTMTAVCQKLIHLEQKYQGCFLLFWFSSQKFKKLNLFGESSISFPFCLLISWMKKGHTIEQRYTTIVVDTLLHWES